MALTMGLDGKQSADEQTARGPGSRSGSYNAYTNASISKCPRISYTKRPCIGCGFCMHAEIKVSAVARCEALSSAIHCLTGDESHLSTYKPWPRESVEVVQSDGGDCKVETLGGRSQM